MNLEISKCRKCEAQVVWAITGTGKKMPVDSRPTSDGTMALYRDGQRETRVLRASSKPDHRDWQLLPGLYTSHFDTCAADGGLKNRPGARASARDPGEQMGLGCSRCDGASEEYVVVGTMHGCEVLCRKCSGEASPFLDMLFRDAAARAKKRKKQEEQGPQEDEEVLL